MRHVPAVILAVALCAISSAAAADPPPFPQPLPPGPNEIQPPVAGTVTTLGASGVHSTIAGVSGSYRAYDRPVTVAFDYGTTTAYGQQTAPSPRPTATEGGPTRFVATLMGLAPQTTYHYRITVTSDLGSFTGDDASFTTTPEAPVQVNSGATILIGGRSSLLTVVCTGEADNSCIGSVRISVMQTIRHKQYSVLLGTGNFSFSTGPITGPGAILPTLVKAGEQVPISLTPAARTILAKTTHFWATATLSIQRGKTETVRVLFRSDTARAVPQASGPKRNALYGSGTCQLVSGPKPLGYVGCSGSDLFTNARGRISGFGARYNVGKRYQCIAQLYNAPKTYPVASDSSFHFSEVMAQGSHGPRGTRTVSGRFTSPTAVSGAYRYTLGRSGCHDKLRRFRMRFIGTPAS